MKINIDRINKAEVKLSQLEAQRDQLVKRVKSQNSSTNRKNDTRKKILIGSAFISMVNKGQCASEWLNAILDDYLTREEDRGLFDLPPIIKALD